MCESLRPETTVRRFRSFPIWRAFTERNVFYALCAYCLWAYFDTTSKYPDAPKNPDIGWMLILLIGFLCGRYYERHRREFGDLPPEERKELETRERLMREYAKQGIKYKGDV